MPITSRLFMAALLFGSTLQSHPAGPGTVHVRVTDNEGGAIYDAFVLVQPYGEVPQPRVPVEVKARTDHFGAADLRLRPGFADVCVLAEALTPQCRKVFVQAGTDQILKISTTVDPGVAKQLGDTAR